MKARESGMPDEQMWQEFFDPDTILDNLGIQNIAGHIVDFGCGYGTFTIPAARRTQGIVYAIDIEAEMVHVTRENVKHHGLGNVVVLQRDFLAEGTGLTERSCEFVMVFNILHAENPLTILTEAKRILVVGGRVGVIHWNYDPATPRGPSMHIRPRPEQCQTWLAEAGFTLMGTTIPLPPFHYSLVGIKAR
jgi:ubiquinone/menaquinone biosynthesis C-methylase UbiE